MILTSNLHNTLVSIDPGKWACGVAVWQKMDEMHASLIHAEFADSTSSRSVARAQGWSDVGRMVVGRLDTLNLGKYSLILEIPQVYAGEQDENKNDLLDLAGVQGAIAACSGQWVVWSPLPREWKGQLPKEISRKRVDAALTDEEKARVKWPSSKLKHNVYDALHLGLVFLQKNKLRP